MYGLLGKSVEELVQTLNQDGICTKTGHCWSQSSVARILHNPIYVQADAAVYRYFQQQHAILPQQADAYTQGNGCLVYGNAQQRAGSKFTQLEGEHIMPCQHRGYIPAALWLTVQKRLQARAGASNRGSGSMTWLQGLLLCGRCNLRFYGKRNGAGTVYLVCRGKRQGICPGIPALRAEVTGASGCWAVCHAALAGDFAVGCPGRTYAAVDSNHFQQCASAAPVLIGRAGKAASGAAAAGGNL